MKREDNVEPSASRCDSDRARLAASARDLVRRRLTFALPYVIVSLGSYLAVAVLAAFTEVFSERWVGPLSLLAAILLAFIPVVGVCASIYARRAQTWDRIAASLRDRREDGP